ncbi:hypothetical protein QML37_31420, partial [Klebsiella pneumoniae]|uniref:hypothetical protein n=1 Tax=Klebsiella pneumoniae TaxID=573 RepID=UPI003A809487
RDQDRIFKVLAGLPHDYEHLHSQVLMANDLPSLSSVFSMLIREESRRKAMGLQESVPEKPDGEEMGIRIPLFKPWDSRLLTPIFFFEME